MTKTQRDKLDRIFSEFIRLRDSNKDGYFMCISCGKLVHWKEGDCGHFINRQHMSLRFSEKNCNGQCRSCNRWDEGNNIGYMRGLVKKYGASIIDELYVKKHHTSKLTDFEAKTMIDYYKEEVKRLKETKDGAVSISKRGDSVGVKIQEAN